ncbi:MAG: hypothetical protein L6408_00550, partial [Nanoarchaeota archaeon]|nr:hypothetical protein [Nanoarchaeota archaeon]
MSDPTTISIEHKNVKSIQYKIVRELHEGEKTVAELSDILVKKIVDEIIEEVSHGGKDVRNLANLLYDSEGIISRGLNGLTDHGFVDRKYVTLCNEPDPIKRKYFLTETGQEFYQSVWVTP